MVSLDDFIGQEQIKNSIRVAAKSSLLKRGNFPHTIMSGPPGLGKSTIAKIIAEETASEFYSFLATTIDGESQIESILGKIKKDGYNLKTGEIADRDKIVPCVIFIDEIHNLKKKTMEMLHTVLENNTITIKRKNYIFGNMEPTVCWVPEFCLIGATNYLGILPKPFRDRFKMNFVFESYNDSEIMTILSNQCIKTGTKISKDGLLEIAKKSRGIPRIALAFLDKSIDVSIANGTYSGKEVSLDDIKYMFSCDDIDNLGLTRADRKVLKYLTVVSRPVGLKSLAQAIDEDVSTLETVIEPYLVRLELIIRTGNGRYLTDKGKAHINSERRLNLYPVER